MSCGAGPEVIEDGLVLCLDAANKRSYPGSGTTWTDMSGNGSNGTLTNGPTFDSTNGGSVVFDGVDDYVTIPQPAVTFSPNRWTICTWMKPNNQYSRFLTPNSNGIDQYLEFDTAGVVNIKIASAGDTNERVRGGTAGTIPVGQWSYSCVSIDDLVIKIYANGILTNEYTETLSIGDWSSTWYLGQRGNSANWYSGLISKLTAYNRALTAAEIKQNFNAVRSRFGI